MQMTKENALIDSLRALESVIVAYSGGVDSSLLAYYARKALGEKAKVVIAVSASLATDELEAARQQADAFGWNLIEIETKEIDLPEYQKNDAMRCYFCKKTLFTELEEMAQAQGIKHIAYGANMDDKQDFRPGHKAAREFSVVSPLQDAQLSKTEIRDLAKRAGLPSWDRP
jgi:pyridinium-3,5-biscarboxylic acid mononucleotide sulfurtransferase